MAQIRLNKFLAERLGLSRREADDLISSKKAKINGKIAEIGAKISPEDEIVVSGHIVPFEVKYTYLALNKPKNYVCSRKKQDNSPTIYELLPKKYASLKTVGRLDKDSSGLILLTNDGDFAFKMTHPKFTKTKVYEVELDRNLAPLHQQMISDFGVNLNDGISKLGLLNLSKSPEHRKNWQVTMQEGRNRQIRRTFAALGYTVVSLHRTGFGPYALNNLPPGEFLILQ